MADEIETNFNFWVPIEPIQKSSKEDASFEDKDRIIEGIASTDDRDLQGEIIDPKGIDYSYFIKHGVINDNHGKNIEDIIGEPIDCKITKAGFYLKAKLYKGKEKSDFWWNHLNSLEASNARLKAGFSIEGKTISRGPGGKIQRCYLTAVALTQCPVNVSTWASIAKSLSKLEFCKHPWRSLEKSCGDCPGKGSCKSNIAKVEEEEKSLSSNAMSAILAPQSLEGKVKNNVNKSLGFKEVIQYLIKEEGYPESKARIVAKALFLNQKNKLT